MSRDIFPLPGSLVVLAPSHRRAHDVLRVDKGIHPRHPAIRVFTRADALCGFRPPVPVLVIDDFAIDRRELALFDEFVRIGRIRDWSEEETAAVLLPRGAE